jgi:hypothetical protein
VAYVRTVKTSSGATGVQIVWSWRQGSRSIEHLGSAQDDVELAALKTAAVERLAAGQTELDLGISGGVEPGMLPILSSQMTHLWEVLCAAYRILGFESATKSDTVFRDQVLARIIEPSSKIDAERVLSEVGASPASYATVKRRLCGYAQPGWRSSLAAACEAHAGLGLSRSSARRLRAVRPPSGLPADPVPDVTHIVGRLTYSCSCVRHGRQHRLQRVRPRGHRPVRVRPAKGFRRETRLGPRRLR